MTYQLIKGTFHVVGYAPDGDSIRFVASDPAHWSAFKWKTKAAQNNPRKQLRLEGIDALETHYEGFHQPRAFALAALQTLLGLLGIEGVAFNLAMTSITAARDGTPGYLAVLGLDRYDRPISLAFAGDTPLADGSAVESTGLDLDASVNARLLQLGLAYPTFYDSMPADLMARFATLTQAARASRTGLWALDRSSGFAFWGLNTIQDDMIVLPKLFRRLIEFMLASSDAAELGPYLTKSSSRVLLRSSGKRTTLGKLVSVNGRQVSLIEPPEELIFTA